MSRRELRPHQTRALSMLRASIAAGRNRPVLNAPCGFGKTVIASQFTRCALLEGGTVIMTVPMKSLIPQTVEMFRSEGISTVGVMQADNPLTNRTMPVQVATVQTLMRRDIPKASVVLIDENHIQFDFVRKWMTDPAWKDVPFIGLSATPWAKGMGQYWNDLCIPTSTRELIDAGFLSNFRVFAPPSGIKPDLSKIGVSHQAHGKDYVVGQLSAEMRKAALVADAVDTWKSMAFGRPTLVYAVDRAHADALHVRYCDAGIDARYVDAFTPLKEREEIKQASRRGEVEVVVSIGTMIIGCDWPWVSCLQICRPTKSEMLHVQITGRGLRKSDGKDYCLILDHTRNTETLGLVTDIHHETLSEDDKEVRGKSKAEEALPKECPKCHHIKPPKVSICPNCGFHAKKQNTVTTAKGTLEEVKATKKKASKGDKQIWWSGLLYHACVRGYARGWAAHKYQEKFGVWPKDVRDIPTEPTPEVLRYIQSRNIAWAKRRVA
jgi:superfamily II DNA or RNA helicase